MSFKLDDELATTLNEQEVKRAVQDLTTFLYSNDLRPIDKRKQGGALWVIGDKSIQPIIEASQKQFGVKWFYSEKGGKATGYKSGWFTNGEKKTDNDFYTIVKHIGVISENANGWTKEINYISYNGSTPKLDIRDWAVDHERMGKGISLSEEEAQVMYELLKNELE